jgi:hypothetical protein
MRGDPVEAFDKAFELAARLAEAMRHALGEHGLNTSRAEVIYLLARDAAGRWVRRASATSLRSSSYLGCLDRVRGRHRPLDDQQTPGLGTRDAR